MLTQVLKRKVCRLGKRNMTVKGLAREIAVLFQIEVGGSEREITELGFDKWFNERFGEIADFETETDVEPNLNQKLNLVNFLKNQN